MRSALQVLWRQLRDRATLRGGANVRPGAASITAGLNGAQLVRVQAAAGAAMALTYLLLASAPTTVLAAAAPAAAEPASSPPPATSTGRAATAPTAAPEPTVSAPPNTSAHPAETASTTAVVQQPRPFGYVLGDTLIQHILLGPAGGEFQPESLPPTERAGLWFARRSSKIQRAEDDRRWLVIDYQLVNAPQALMTVNLPTITLKSKAGTVLVVPPWPISVAPLTPRAVFATGGLQELRPDHPAPLLPTTMLRRQLGTWVIAFAVTVAIWIGWWLVRTLRAAANQPFARALREIRQTSDDSAAAWLALHRAFDSTAGRALQTTTLPTLFKRAPHLETQRAAIERFYVQSNLRFFGVTSAGDSTRTGSHTAATVVSDGGTTVSLRTLATTLRRIEKQHER